MLVLARRPNDKVLFPQVGITVQVIRLDGKSVRLGIEAPDHIRILRHELVTPGELETMEPYADPAQRHLTHALRNRLHLATMGLQLVKNLFEAGQWEQMESTLRRVLSELEKLDNEAQIPSPSQSVPHEPRPLRALLVEDNDCEAELLAGWMRSQNYDVTRAHDGFAALEYLETQARPDIVLLDMNMPRLDGAATIERIRSNPQHAGLKVFAVTGLALEATNVPLGPQGADLWFQKPVKPEVLLKEIQRACVGVQLPA